MLKHQTGRSGSLGKAVIRGTATSLTAAFLWAAVLAWLVDRELIPMEAIGYGILPGHLIPVFLGAWITTGGAGKEGPMGAMLTGGIHYLVLLLVNALFFGGSYVGLGTTLLLVALAAAAAVLLSEKTGRKKNRKRYKIPK